MKFQSILNILFPPSCANCAAPTAGGAICRRCFASIETYRTLFCGTCRARLPESKKICHMSAPHILGAAAPYENDAVRSLIHALKFRFVESAAEPLASLLSAYAALLPVRLSEYVVLPVPLGRKRLRERGFNQAELIAKFFASDLGLLVDSGTLFRLRDTAPQSEQSDAEERRRNVAGCFSIRPGAAVDGKKFILIDDVATTGATLSEAARTLKAGGARSVLAFAVART